MATTALGTVLHNLRRSLLRQDEAGLTDGELLECFVTRRDEAAFEALLRRHGTMVLGVCRRVLQNEADAEDAFQATFLVLVRKAAFIQPRGMVGNWLYGVAHSTALKARAMSTKRLAKEREAAARSKPEAAETWERLHALLDQELKALPDKYRAAIVLCDLEGKSIKEAARQLSCPQGTVGTRLARGRRMLARRLARHGLTLSGGVIATVLSQNAAAASVPLPLVTSTMKAASLFAAGQAASGVACAKVAALTEGVLKAMLLTKLKLVTAALLAFTVLGAGVVGLTHQSQAADPTEVAQKDRPEADKPKSDEDLLQGSWLVVAVDSGGSGKLPEEFVKKTYHPWVIKGDKLTYQMQDAKCAGSFKLNPTKKPKEIDYTETDSSYVRVHNNGQPSLHKGIYKLDGDSLTICWSLNNQERPSEFASKQENPACSVFVLKRQSPADSKADDPQKDTPKPKPPAPEDDPDTKWPADPPRILERQPYILRVRHDGVKILGVSGVFKELKLTEEQIDELWKLDLDLMKLHGEKGQAEQMREYTPVMHDKLPQILKPAQIKRFKQIGWQILGLIGEPHPTVGGLGYPEIQEALKFTDEQKQKIEAINADARKEFEEETKGGVTIPRHLELATKIHKAALEKALPMLSEDQRKAWERMVGEPFVFSQDRYQLEKGEYKKLDDDGSAGKE